MTGIDRAVGKILVPPIVRWCQWSGMSQWRVASGSFMLAFLLDLYGVLNFEPQSWVLAVFVGIICLFYVVQHAINPERQVRTSSGFRTFCVIFFLYMIVDFAINQKPMDGILMGVWFFLVLGEYARSIDTIPPREEKQRLGRLVEDT